MLLGSLITITTISLLIYLVRHKTDRRRSHTHKKRAQNKQHSQFHCVETHPHGKCCNAVKSLHGTRFLSAEAPNLPVTGCDQAHCHCDYIHHDDRRVEIRRTELGIQHDMYGQSGETEKRSKAAHGRRSTD